MKKNKFEVMKIEKDLEQINLELKVVNDGIKQFENYGSHKMDIVNVLRTFEEFCRDQPSLKTNKITQNILYDKYFENKLKSNKFSQAFKTLKKNYENLIQKKLTFEAQINSAYDRLQKTSYNLKAVIIHDGTINSGHYYSYIKYDGKWFCFNDSKVSEVPETLVFEDAKGLKVESRNCYCLIYVKLNIDAIERYEEQTLPPKLMSFVKK